MFTLLAFYYGLWENGYMATSNNIPADVLTNGRTMAFVVLAASQLFYSLSMRNPAKSIVQIGMFKNKLLCVSILFGLFLQFVVISVPFLAKAFGVKFLSLQDWLLVIMFALIPLIVNEIIKIFWRSNK